MSYIVAASATPRWMSTIINYIIYWLFCLSKQDTMTLATCVYNSASCGLIVILGFLTVSVKQFFFLLAHFLLHNHGCFRDLFCSQQICWQIENQTYVYSQCSIVPGNTLKWQFVIPNTFWYFSDKSSDTGSILQAVPMCLSFILKRAETKMISINYSAI